MNNLSKYLLIGILGLSIGLAGSVFAHNGEEVSGKFRGDREGMVERFTEMVGLSQEEVTERLDAGERPHEIAESEGVDLREVKVEHMRERLAQGVEDGKITQEKADEILQKMEDGEIPTRGRGCHKGLKPSGEGK